MQTSGYVWRNAGDAGKELRRDERVYHAHKYCICNSRSAGMIFHA